MLQDDCSVDLSSLSPNETSQVVDVQFSIVKLLNTIYEFVYNIQNQKQGTILQDCQLKVLLSKVQHLVDYLGLEIDRSLNIGQNENDLEGSTDKYMQSFTESFADDLDKLRVGEGAIDQTRLDLLLDSLKEGERIYNSIQ